MKKLAILGDSYSTYKGYIPESYVTWYAPEGNGKENDMKSVDDTWWKIFCKQCGYEIVLNCSYSGSAVCYTGYPEMDGIKTSFIYRMQQDFTALKEKNIMPDLIIVFGGTNDFWNNSPVGMLVDHEPTEEECYAFAPAFYKVMLDLKKDFSKSQFMIVINDEIVSEMRNVQHKVGKILGIPVVQLEAVEKENSHPNTNGMSQIAVQVKNVWENRIISNN